MRFTSGLEQKGGAKKNKKPKKSKKSDPFDDDDEDDDFDSDTKKGKSTHSYYTPNVLPISTFTTILTYIQ